MTVDTPQQFVLGETWVLDFALNDALGADLDLTGATPLSFRLSRRGLVLMTRNLADGVAVTDPLTGQGTVTVTPAQQVTAGLTPGVHRYELRATLAGGAVTTQARGTLTVLRSLF
jgi:hypothetical protein